MTTVKGLSPQTAMSAPRTRTIAAGIAAGALLLAVGGVAGGLIVHSTDKPSTEIAQHGSLTSRGFTVSHIHFGSDARGYETVTAIARNNTGRTETAIFSITIVADDRSGHAVAQSGATLKPGHSAFLAFGSLDKAITTGYGYGLTVSGIGD